MTKKPLNEEIVKSELQDSAYFKQDVHSISNLDPSSDEIHTTERSEKHEAMVSSPDDTVIPRNRDSELETVRKALKSFGKEAATHRFTSIEKQQIADLIYNYRKKGIKTSENELTRIAVNYIINDQKENLENSILDQVLRLLNE